MGATLTAAWIEGTRLSIAHVGDSRAYLLRSGTLQQLTSDHSLVAEQVRHGILTAAEAEESQMQSVLLRALGSQEEVEVDAEEHMVIARDILLLCSDGLTRMVIEPEIAGTLQSEPDAIKAATAAAPSATFQGFDMRPSCRCGGNANTIGRLRAAWQARRPREHSHGWPRSTRGYNPHAPDLAAALGPAGFRPAVPIA